MNSYLVTFDGNQTSRDDFVKKIDRIDQIQNWMMFFDHSGCIVSELSAQALTDLVKEKLPDANFIIVKLEVGKRGGWLRKVVWDFIKNPQPVDG